MKNIIVERRLAFIPDEDIRASYADRFLNGESITTLAEEVGLSRTRMEYCMKQDVVERELTPEFTNGKAWAACVRRVSGGAIEREAKAKEAAPNCFPNI